MAGPTRKKPHGGKGDWTRPCDKEKFDTEFDRIFGEKPLPNEGKNQDERSEDDSDR